MVEDLLNKDYLKFSVCGSVDDGKSTFIGRLLLESGNVFQDQIDSIKALSKKRGFPDNEIDLSLLTDGLIAEREQNITIDVAYRYFSTKHRRFTIIDTPGHEQYTANMITGSSQSDLSIILIDAQQGMTIQSRRHAFIVSLLGISHLAVVINKMDLVDYKEEVYESIRQEFLEFAKRLSIKDISFFPISARFGGNVVKISDKMPWYSGSSLMHYLENVQVTNNNNVIDFRFPVQSILRQDNIRGYIGNVVSGTIQENEEIIVLPKHLKTKVKCIYTNGKAIAKAYAGTPVMLVLEDNIDIARGDMLARTNNLPHVRTEIDALVVWMGGDPLCKNRNYLIKHNYQLINAYCRSILYKIDLNTTSRLTTEKLNYNDIGRISLELSQPIFCDEFSRNKVTGSFILIDKATNNTAAGGIIIERNVKRDRPQKNRDIKIRELERISHELRLKGSKHRPACIFFTGLSGAGKSTIAYGVEKYLMRSGYPAYTLDGDMLRSGLNADLGFREDDRVENLRRVGEVAKIVIDAGMICLCSFVAPYKKHRDIVKNIIGEDNFVEIYVSTSLDVCKSRRINLYEKAERGEVINFPGVNDTYETPENPKLILNCDGNNEKVVIASVISLLGSLDIVRS